MNWPKLRLIALIVICVILSALLIWALMDNPTCNIVCPECPVMDMSECPSLSLLINKDPINAIEKKLFKGVYSCYVKSTNLTYLFYLDTDKDQLILLDDANNPIATIQCKFTFVINENSKRRIMLHIDIDANQPNALANVFPLGTRSNILYGNTFATISISTDSTFNVAFKQYAKTIQYDKMIKSASTNSV